MLPIITEDLLAQVYEEVFSDVAVWRKKMVGHLKEENPEINSYIFGRLNSNKGAKTV